MKAFHGILFIIDDHFLEINIQSLRSFVRTFEMRSECSEFEIHILRQL